MAEIIISPRFRGPPDSANGGYCCGLLARELSGAVEVTLLAPPPLNTPLKIEARNDGVSLFADTTAIAQARSVELDIDLPSSPTWNQAMAAQRRYIGFDAHIYPGCFVCGPQRDADDGLRIFSGPLEDESVVAGPWIPGADLANEQGEIAPEFAWAALDCPGMFGLNRPTLLALLGRMTARLESLPLVGEHCICLGFRLGGEGRKHFAGTALYGADGRLIGYSKQIWIELKT